MTTDDTELTSVELDTITFDDTTSDVVVDGTPLNADEARELTDTIRDGVELLWTLIARAHAGQAWKSLGYPTWESYVRGEFNMSRSRSYQILDQARVITALETAVPEGTKLHVTAATAADIKNDLPEVVAAIEEATEGLDPEQASHVVQDVLKEHRERPVATADDIASETAQAELARIMSTAPGFDRDDASEGSFDSGLHAPPAYTTSTPTAVEPAPTAGAQPSDEDAKRTRRNVHASFEIYAALSALAELPAELDEVIAVITDDRVADVEAHLAIARSNLDKFTELWETREHINDVTND